jgi:CRISPR-associated protein Cmr1
MTSTQLNLETVTPMFLRGYDNTTLELRPPPFKALFRYWWRATQDQTNVRNLFNAEGALFGNASQKSRKSPLLMRLSVSQELKDKYQPLPHHTGGWDCVNCPPDEKPCRKNYSNEAYCPGEQFTITLTAHNLDCYKKIAKLGVLLGGVGNRSRRGFGSLRYQDWSFQNVKEIQQEVYQTLDGISPGRFQDNPGKILVDPIIRLPDYPVIKAVHFGDTLSNNVNDLLRRIGQATHDHSDKALGYAERQKRMASPLHVRIQKVEDQFVPIVTQLNSVFPESPPHNYEQKQQNFIDAVIT